MITYEGEATLLTGNNRPKHIKFLDNNRAEMDGDIVRVLGSGVHPVTKKWYPIIVERQRDFAIFGLR